MVVSWTWQCGNAKLKEITNVCVCLQWKVNANASGNILSLVSFQFFYFRVCHPGFSGEQVSQTLQLATNWNRALRGIGWIACWIWFNRNPHEKFQQPHTQHSFITWTQNSVLCDRSFFFAVQSLSCMANTTRVLSTWGRHFNVSHVSISVPMCKCFVCRDTSVMEKPEEEMLFHDQSKEEPSYRELWSGTRGGSFLKSVSGIDKKGSPKESSSKYPQLYISSQMTQPLGFQLGLFHLPVDRSARLFGVRGIVQRGVTWTCRLFVCSCDISFSLKKKKEKNEIFFFFFARFVRTISDWTKIEFACILGPASFICRPIYFLENRHKGKKSR